MGHSVKIYLTNCLNLLKLLFRNYSTVLTFITLTFMQNTLLVSSLAFQYRDLCELLPSLLHIWLHLGLYSQIECRPSDSWNCILNSQRREGKAEWWLVLVRPFPVWDLWQQLADWGGGVVPPSPWPSSCLSLLTAGVSWLAGTHQISTWMEYDLSIIHIHTTIEWGSARIPVLVFMVLSYMNIIYEHSSHASPIIVCYALRSRYEQIYVKNL